MLLIQKALDEDYYLHVRTFVCLKLLKIVCVLLIISISKCQHTDMPFKIFDNQQAAEPEKHQYSKIAIYQDKILNNKIRLDK